MLKFIIGLLIVIAGAFMVIKYQWMHENFGEISWAEKVGGTASAYKLIGVIFAVVGFLVMFNIYESILMFIFGPLFGR